MASTLPATTPDAPSAFEAATYRRFRGGSRRCCCSATWSRISTA